MTLLFKITNIRCDRKFKWCLRQQMNYWAWTKYRFIHTIHSELLEGHPFFDTLYQAKYLIWRTSRIKHTRHSQGRSGDKYLGHLPALFSHPDFQCKASSNWLSGYLSGSAVSSLKQLRHICQCKLNIASRLFDW